MQPNFLIQIIQRIASEQPEFFKQLQRYAIYVGIVVAILYGLVWLDIIHVKPEVHAKISSLVKYIETFLAGGLAGTSVATKNPNLVSPDTKQAVIKDASENSNEQL